MKQLDLVDSVALNIKDQNGRTTRTIVGGLGGFVIPQIFLVIDLFS